MAASWYYLLALAQIGLELGAMILHYKGFSFQLFGLPYSMIT